MATAGILSLLGKVFSPKTQARNLKSGRDFKRAQGIASGKQVFSPKTQIRNIASAGNFKIAQGMARNAQSESLRHATAKVDDLIKRGMVNKNVRKEDLIRKMDQYLSGQYDDALKKIMSPDIPSPIPGGNLTAFPKELIRSLGDKAVWIALGAGGIAGYKTAENKAENIKRQEALQQMEEETQIGPVKGYFKDIGFGEEEGEWGEPIANLLMDVISPIPRYK